MLLDSNLIIYPASPDYPSLRQFIADHTPAVSVISLIEVLGFHRLSETERTIYTAFFATSTLLPINQEVIDQAVQLRQRRKMSLGDAIIAGTALIHNRTLLTHNVKDFQWISDLTVLDPLV